MSVDGHTVAEIMLAGPALLALGLVAFNALFWTRGRALPDAVVACVGGGSNAAGIFHPFVQDAGVRLIGVEAGGRGAGASDMTPASSEGMLAIFLVRHVGVSTLSDEARAGMCASCCV